VDHEKINYVEYAANDIATTKFFFTEVFNWVFEDFGEQYTAFTNAGLNGGFYHADKSSVSETGGALMVLYSYDIEVSYQKIKKAGGINLQVLGIGANGHIGFNEPGDQLNVTTHLVDLTKETINANSRFFNSKKNVPKKALTVGIATILKSDRIILLASGKNKAEAIKKTVDENLTTQVPSSLLQTHPDVTLIIDEEAASLI
jgi:6-phosphogluconolactonase/glucosamine-6-phosphate isomerase/deaminase